MEKGKKVKIEKRKRRKRKEKGGKWRKAPIIDGSVSNTWYKLSKRICKIVIYTNFQIFIYLCMKKMKKENKNRKKENKISKKKN